MGFKKHRTKNAKSKKLSNKKINISRKKTLIYGGNSNKPFRTNFDLKHAVFGYFNNLDDRAKIIKMYGNITNWNTTEITDMTEIFNYIRPIAEVDNLIVLTWDTRNVTTMENMFYGCQLNFKIEFTTTKKVENMSCMFYDARNFNEPLLESFDTNNVTNMSFMFFGASVYNQPFPKSFKTNYVKNMNSMFKNALEFNQPIIFNTENVLSVSNMFENARSFNQPINLNLTKIKNEYYLSSLFKDTVNMDSSINIKLHPHLAYKLKQDSNERPSFFLSVFDIFLNNIFEESKIMSFPNNKPIINGNFIQFFNEVDSTYYLLKKHDEMSGKNEYPQYLLDDQKYYEYFL